MIEPTREERETGDKIAAEFNEYAIGGTAMPMDVKALGLRIARALAARRGGDALSTATEPRATAPIASDAASDAAPAEIRLAGALAECLRCRFGDLSWCRDMYGVWDHISIEALAFLGESSLALADIEAALRAVPWRCEHCHKSTEEIRSGECSGSSYKGDAHCTRPDYPAMARAVRALGEKR